MTGKTRPLAPLGYIVVALALVLGIALTASGAFAGKLTDTAYGLSGASVPVVPNSSNVAISQVYGAGGNSGSIYRNDFIELTNRSSAPVSVAGWSVQYASATGAFSGLTVLSGTIAPGGYYLVQEAAGTGGTTNLPTPDAIGTISMSGTAGKVALVSNSTLLACGTSTTRCLPNPNIVDYVGYGATATDYEGTGPAPALPSNTASEQRNNAGCTDTDDNATDFTAPTAAPRNSQSPPHADCGITGTPTSTFTPSLTPTSTPVCGPGAAYQTIATTGATFVPGTDDIGNHCDDCTTVITLPFSFSLYGTPYTQARVSDNGNIQFLSNNNSFNNTCLPNAGMNDAILPYWDGLRTDIVTGTVPSGIFTSISGVAPNRILNIEWRACKFAAGGCGAGVNFEVRLYEGLDQFDFVYNVVENNGQTATVGVQKGTGPRYTQYSCNTPLLSSGLQVTFRPYTCGEPTFTPTPSGTSTATRTPTSLTATPLVSSTPTATHPPSGSVVISEFRTRGTNGALDEFVELYNLSSSPVNIGGWELWGSSGCGSAISSRATITNNLTLPSHYHYLFANSGYSGTVTPDQTYSTGFSDNGGIALLDQAGNVIDAAGMCTTTTFVEGTPLTPLTSDANESYERKPGGAAGSTQDTNDNASDFLLRSPSDPQNLASGPTPPNSTPTATATCAPSNGAVTIFNFAYNPNPITVYQGATIRWTNIDAASHTATNDTPAFDTGVLATGQSADVTFNTAGTFNYHCAIHPSMVAQVVVLSGCPPPATATPTMTATFTATATPAAAANLVVHVTWQGIPQPNARNVLPITETLRLTAGGPLYTFAGNTDASGFFTSDVSTLPAGTYNIRTQGRISLASCSTVTLTGSGTIQKEMGTQKAGDSNSTNVVNSTDFNIVKASFGKSVGQPGYDSRADFDNTQVVNSTDFNLLKGNFGQSGCNAVLAPEGLNLPSNSTTMLYADNSAQELFTNC